MTLRERWRGLADADGFVVANVALLSAWLLVSMVAATTPVFQSHVLPIPLTFAAIWNVASFRRIAATRLWPLHLAPYVTVAGGYDLLWALLESANNGPWVQGFQPWPWWEAPLQLAGIPALLVWPAATLILALAKPRQAT